MPERGFGTTVLLAVVVVVWVPLAAKPAELHWLGEKLLVESERPITASAVTMCLPSM